MRTAPDNIKAYLGMAQVELADTIDDLEQQQEDGENVLDELLTARDVYRDRFEGFYE